MQPQSVYISYEASEPAWYERIRTLFSDAGFYLLNQPPGKDPTLAARTRESAEVFVLLVTPAYLKSPDLVEVELPHIRSIAQARGKRAIAVIVAPCEWRGFIDQAAFQVFPNDGTRPLASGGQKQIRDDLSALANLVHRETEAGSGDASGMEESQSDESVAPEAAMVEEEATEAASALGSTRVPAPEVYISSARADQKWRDRIHSFLRNANFRVGYALDSTNAQSEYVSEKMREQSSVFVLLVSQSYLDSREINGTEFPDIRSLVVNKDRPVIYVILEQCPWQNQIFLPLRRVETVPSGSRTFAEMGEEEIKDDLHALARKVQGALRGEPDPWIKQETFERFSQQSVRILSRASALRGGPDRGMVHTGHVLQAFREEAALGNGPAELINFIKKKEMLLSQVLGGTEPYGVVRDFRLLGRMPQVSDNVRTALVTAIDRAGANESIEASHILFGVLSTNANPRVRELNKQGMTPEAVILDLFRQKARAHKQAEAKKAAAQEEADESIALSNICDAPTEEDALGFKPYVEAIARFLKSDKTKPPLTLSIEGEWGSGKSSFMLQLEKAVSGEPLRNRLREAACLCIVPSAPCSVGVLYLLTKRLWAALWQTRFSVRFNPWRHDEGESLWAAFALEFLRQVSHQRFFLRRWWGTMRLFAAHYSWRKGWFEALRAVVVWIVIVLLVVALPVGVFVYKPHWAQQTAKALNEKLSQPAAQTNFTRPVPPTVTEGGKKSEQEERKPEEGKKDNFDVFLKVLLLTGGNAAYFAVVLTIWLKAREVIGNPLEIDLKKYLESPDYEGRVAFVEQFHEDFRRVVDSYVGKGLVYVFVDDLDRCEVPKAADLIKALNLMIADDPRLIFILGMDREKVAAGLAVKYERLLPYLLADGPAIGDEAGWKRRGGLEFGQTFLQKFIQLPFRVPGPNIDTYSEFIGRFSGAAAPKRSDGALSGVGTASEESTATAGQSMESESKQGPPHDVAQDSGEEIRATMPPPRIATPEEAEKRRERELQFRGDSPKFQAAAMMFAETLGTNPRRLIQFINLLRLQAYIVNGIGFFDRGVKGGNPITVEQLAKFVAINLSWPALLADFATQPQVLAELEDYANDRKEADEFGQKPKPTTTQNSWLSQRGMTQFLKYGMEKDAQNYTLKNPTLYRLLHICPQRIKTQQEPAKTIAAMAGRAMGTNARQSN